MAELAAAEVYAPRTIQVWRTLLNWMAFFFQIFAQILRGTPSFTQVFSYIGLGHGSLLSSAPHAPAEFKRLPVVEMSEFPEETEEAPPPSNPTSVPVSVGGERMIASPPPYEKLMVTLLRLKLKLEIFEFDQLTRDKQTIVVAVFIVVDFAKCLIVAVD